MGILQKVAELHSNPRGRRTLWKSSGQKVMTGCFSGSNEGRERFLERWTGELRKKPLEEVRRLEARKTTKMEQQDSSSGRRTEWAFII